MTKEFLEGIRDNDNYPPQTRLLAEMVLGQRQILQLMAISQLEKHPDVKRPEPEEKKPPIVVKKQNRR